MPFVRLFLAATLLVTALPALAQTTKPASHDAAKADALKPETSAAPKKEKKPRSEAQKKNDERMRACGTEWRAAKAANKTEGKSWREFSKDCRRKKKGG